MKFGSYLIAHIKKEWEANYINYRALKKLISLSLHNLDGDGANSPRMTSLSFARPLPTAAENFFLKLEEELDKVNQFTLSEIENLKTAIKQLNARAGRKDIDSAALDVVHAEVRNVGEEFQALEKYVNLNYMGFCKILKKHGKQLPGLGAARFGMGHLRQQPFAQGRHMELMLPLSQVYAKLTVRRGRSHVAVDTPGVGFVHVVRKFWVKDEHMPRVRTSIMQVLPILPSPSPSGEPLAEHVVNSIFLDNGSMELYHSRLFDKHHAITMRIKWHGTEPPDVVKVERRTHNESWRQEDCFKEKLQVMRKDVVDYLRGACSPEDALIDLHGAGVSVPDPGHYSRMFRSIQEVVDAKQLLPCVRTQYIRTVFQVPFDPSVRVTMDSNLTLFSEEELPYESPKRDPNSWLQTITHITPDKEAVGFPHHILVVSHYRREGETQPAWLTELQEMGLLQEIDEFTKFVHGVATLYPELVRALPYWVDDESLHRTHAHIRLAPFRRVRDSEDGSHAGSFSATNSNGANGANGASHDEAQPLLPRAKLPGGQRLMHYNPHMYLQNERMLMLWLELAVVLASTGAGLLGFAGYAFNTNHHRSPLHIAEFIGLTLLPIGCALSAYGAAAFLRRMRCLQTQRWPEFHDTLGHTLLACAVIFALLVILIAAVTDWIMTVDSRTPRPPRLQPPPPGLQPPPPGLQDGRGGVQSDGAWAAW